jgi:hypothetical protein
MYIYVIDESQNPLDVSFLMKKKTQSWYMYVYAYVNCVIISELLQVFSRFGVLIFLSRAQAKRNLLY